MPDNQLSVLISKYAAWKVRQSLRATQTSASLHHGWFPAMIQKIKATPNCRYPCVSSQMATVSDHVRGWDG